MRLYLIHPKSAFPSYFGADVLETAGYAPAAGVADLALPTVAALAAPYLAVSLCDETVEQVDLEVDAEIVGLTGYVNQWERTRELADHYRAAGKVVVIGGPYASLSPDAVRPHCDVLVRGELEPIAAALFADLAAGTHKPEYEAGRPDLATSPVPRWDLYPNARTLTASVQTSRGCPFECEFCDVIQYLDRTQRHKDPAQVLRELDEVYRHGYRYVFLADDNLTVYRSRAKELMAAIRDWNARQERGHVRFFTQCSIDAARDPELLQLCAEAGLTYAFIGIETPNEESLRETKKRQNVGIDLIEQLQRFHDYGIVVMGGMIVGFDHDGPDIFEMQLAFAQATSIPLFSLGALVAPDKTPLRARLAVEGRLAPDGSEWSASPWSTNVLPKLLSREELVEGLRWLSNRLYNTQAFGERLCRLLDGIGPRRMPGAAGGLSFRSLRQVELDMLKLVNGFAKLGPEEAALWHRLRARIAKRPELKELVVMMLFRYLQTRDLLRRGSFWDPSVPAQPPAFAARR